MAENQKSFWRLVSQLTKATHTVPMVPALILTPIIVVVYPLMNTATDISQVPASLISSLLGQAAGLYLLYLFQLYSKNNAVEFRLWMLGLMGLLVGATRGAAMHLSLILLFPEANNPGLGSLVFFNALTWGLSLPALAVPNYFVRQANRKIQNLEHQTAGILNEQVSLKAQLDWLVGRRVIGIGKELESAFAAVSAKLLASSSQSPQAAYLEIANSLKEASSEAVRKRSHELIGDEVVNRGEAPIVAAAKDALFRNPLVVAVPLIHYALGALVTAFRQSGLVGLGFTLLLTALLWLLLILGRRINAAFSFLKPITPHLIVVVITAVSALSLWFGYGVTDGQLAWFVISTSISTVLWLEMSIFAGAWLVTSLNRYREKLTELSEAKKLSEADLEWLGERLEQTNLELAKYLHGILQTRLMAHALNLESLVHAGDIAAVKQSTLKLAEVLSKPMLDFKPGELDAHGYLQSLQDDWQGMMSISCFDNHPAISCLDLCSISEPVVVMQVLREAVANASKHGYANQVWVSVVDGDYRVLVVEDNGIGPRLGNPGMGSGIFDSVASGNWSLTQVATGARFEIELPLPKRERI